MEVKSLFMRIGGGIACIVLFAMLFTACIDPATNNNDPYQNSYKPSVDTVGATYADVLFCTAEELQTLSSYEYFLYKESNTNSEYSSWNNDDNLSIKKSIYADKFSEEPLIPNTNYTLKITYTLKNYDKIERSVTFKTKPYDFSSYKLQYDDIYDTVYIYTNELKVGDLKVYRSETADGEYSEIKIEGGAYPFLFCRDESDTLETDKTYYYKIKIFDSSSDKLLYESTTPLSIKVGVIPPEPVNMESLKTLQGITRVKFTWDEVDGADEYYVEVRADDLWDPIVLDTKTVTEAAYEFDAIECVENFTLSSNKEYEIRITAKNAGGTSLEKYKSFYLYLPKISKVEVIPGQKEAQYICSSNIDYIPEGCSIEYALKETYDGDAIVSSIEPIFTRTGLLIDTEYYSYSSYYIPGRVYLNITYMDKNGESQTYTSNYMEVNRFRTGNFDAVTNLEAIEEKTTSVKYKFSPLTTEQLNKQNVYYYVIAEDGITSPIIKKIDNPAAEYQVIDSLEAGREYSLKILVSSESSLYSSDLEDYKTFAEIKVITDSGLSKPTNIVLSEEAGIMPTQPYLNVTWDKIAEDDGTGNVAYEIEYKVLKKSNFFKFTHEVDGDYVNTYINEYSAKMPVNAGNRYIVRVVAYKVDDTSSKVYSDEKVIQFSKFDDRSLATALLYPSAVGDHAAGDVIDFADPNVWDGSTSLKSSLTKGYNFGLTQFMGEAGTGLNFIKPSGNPEYFAFKISFDGKDADNAVGIDSSYIPRLIFVDRNAFSLTSLEKTYGEFSKIYIVIPDTEGYILKTFEDDASDYLYENVNMPYFMQSGTSYSSSTSAQSAGIEINETWIYNNSVYIGVKQELAGNLGFSYFY